MPIQRIFVDVDVQNDFCEPSGALFVKGSPNDLYRALTRHAVRAGVPILGSVDSHAWDAWEFASNDRLGPEGAKPNFPDHCVKGTPGWLKVQGTLPPRFRFLPNAEGVPFAAVIDEVVAGKTQGVYFEKEVYSLFANPLAERFLAELVAKIGASPELIVYGVATDYCVKAAALGLAERGYRTTLVTDAVAGITAEGTDAALAAMAAAGVRFTTAAAVMGDYPRPSLTADVVVLAPGEGQAHKVLFIRRKHDPYAGCWALPGGFVEPDETVGEGAVRELREETTLSGVPVEEIGCFSRPGRDPRGWVVSVAHLAQVPADRMREAKPADDAAATAWLDLRITEGGWALSHDGAPVEELAFDHRDIIAAAVARLRASR
jgi:nicotinamidase/pyrazinamidase